MMATSINETIHHNNYQMKIIKRKIVLFAICFPLLSQAQYLLNNSSNPETGIMFERKLNWIQILEKAKTDFPCFVPMFNKLPSQIGSGKL